MAAGGFDEVARLHELFAAFGPVGIRRMFGGLGIHADGVMFALAYDGLVYLKTDAHSVADFDREGSRPFGYATRDGRHTIPSFRSLPDRLYDDTHELAGWAGNAVAATRRAKARSRSGAKSQDGAGRAVRPRGARPSGNR
jgi:DNA transformation protein